MNFKKIGFYSILILIVLGFGFLSYEGLHKPSPTPTNNVSITEITKSAVTETKDSQPKVSLSNNVTKAIKTVKSEIQINAYWIVIFFLMLALNLLSLVILVKVLAWRKTLSNGMMAILPDEIITSVRVVSENQNKLGNWLQASISQVSKSLLDQVESVSILKKELALKEDKLTYYRSGAISNEKEKVISKVLKLHSFLRTLEEQVAAGGIEHGVAISFLRDELADLFVDFNILEINPNVGSLVKDLPHEGYTIKSVLKVSDVNLNQTVAEVLEPGYFVKFDEKKGKVMKPASITINKFGE